MAAKKKNNESSNGEDDQVLRYSVSLVTQGRLFFYTLTMPSEVLARTCKVSTRKEDPKKGFQRTLDEKRAAEIAHYIDEGMGTIPNSIVLSAQPEAELKIVGRGKTVQFRDTPGAFLILDGQHRVYGFSKAKTKLRVPVVIYNGLSRRDESRLFIDINTKQKPVPAQLLLDIKNLAEIEDENEAVLRHVFDLFHKSKDSVLADYMAPFESAKNKITRVTFNASVKPLLEIFAGRSTSEIYEILNNYIAALVACLEQRAQASHIGKPVVFRAFLGLFPSVAQRVLDRSGGDYSYGNFYEVVAPIFVKMPKSKLDTPGTSSALLKEYLEKRIRSKLAL